MPGPGSRREDPGRTPARARPEESALVVLFDALWFGEAADPETSSDSRRGKVIDSGTVYPVVQDVEDDVAPQGVVSALEVGVHRAGMRLPSALGQPTHRPRGRPVIAASWHAAMPPQLGAPAVTHSAPPAPAAVAHTLAGAAAGAPGTRPPRLDPTTWLPTTAAAGGAGAGGGWLPTAAAAGGAPSPASDPGVMLPVGTLMSRMTSCPAVLPWPAVLQPPAAQLTVPADPGHTYQWPQRWSPTIGTLLLPGDAQMQRSASAPAAPRPLADAVEDDEAGGHSSGLGPSTIHQSSSSTSHWAAVAVSGQQPNISSSSSNNMCCTWRTTLPTDAATEAAASAGDRAWSGEAVQRSSSSSTSADQARNSAALSTLSEVVLGELGNSTSTSTTTATPTTSSPMTCNTSRSSTDLSLARVQPVPVACDTRCQMCGMSPVVEGEEGAPTCTCSSQTQQLLGSLLQARCSDPTPAAAAAAAAAAAGGGGEDVGSAAAQGTLLSYAGGWLPAGVPECGCSWDRAVYHSATSMEAAAEAAVAALGGTEAVATLLAGLAGSGVLSGAEGGATVEEEEGVQDLLCGSSDTGSSVPSSAAQLHQDQQLAAAMAVMAAAAAAAHQEAGLDGLGPLEAHGGGGSIGSDAAAWRYWFAARWRQARRGHLQGRGAADSPDPLQFLKVHGEGVAAQLAAAAAAGQAQQQQRQTDAQAGNAQHTHERRAGAGGGVTSGAGGALGTYSSASRLLSSALALDSGGSSWPAVDGSGGLMGCSGGEAVAELAREAAAAAALLQAARTGGRPVQLCHGLHPLRHRDHKPVGPAAAGAQRPAVVVPVDRRWVGMLLPAAAVTLGGDSRQAFIMARLLDGCAGASKVLLRGAPRVPPEQLLADLQLEVTAAAAAARLPNTALVQFCGAGVLLVGAGRSVHVVMSSTPGPSPLAGFGTRSAAADVAASVARALVGDSGSLAAAAAALLRTHLPQDCSITY